MALLGPGNAHLSGAWCGSLLICLLPWFQPFGQKKISSVSRATAPCIMKILNVVLVAPVIRIKSFVTCTALSVWAVNLEWFLYVLLFVFHSINIISTPSYLIRFTKNIICRYVHINCFIIIIIIIIIIIAAWMLFIHHCRLNALYLCDVPCSNARWISFHSLGIQLVSPCTLQIQQVNERRVFFTALIKSMDEWVTNELFLTALLSISEF